MALATPIFRPCIPAAQKAGRGLCWLADAGLLLIGLNQALAEPPAAQTDILAYANKTFQEAKVHYQQKPADATAAWQFGRACFDMADLATNNAQRATLAQQGIAACRLAVTRDPASAPAHYYLGMNQGQLAQTKGLSALKLVGQMEREFTRARELDERFDFGGPDRNLGLLYRDAPVIASIGSRTCARAHLTRAVELAPEYPENRLCLIEAYVGWREQAAAARQLQSVERVWSAARTNFVGIAWASSWADWQPRLTKLQHKLQQRPKP